MYRIAICDSSLKEGDCIRGELEKELGKEVTVIVYRQAEDFVADYAREKEKKCCGYPADGSGIWGKHRTGACSGCAKAFCSNEADFYQQEGRKR